MKNLLSELQKTQPQALDRQMAEFECMTIPESVRILARQLQFWLVTLLARFLPAAKQKKEQISWDCMEFRMQQAQEKFKNQAIGQKKQEICGQLRKKIRMASGKTIRQNVQEDVLSAEVIKAAAGLLPKHQIRGKSVAEISDLICRTYPEMKNREMTRQLKLWFVYALAWILLLLCAGKILAWNMPLLLVEAVLGEIVIAWIVSIRLARLQLAHFVWLIVSAAGTLVVEEQSMPVYQMIADDRKRLALVLQGIHTLYRSGEMVTKEQAAIDKKMQELEKAMVHNQEQIHRQEQMTESHSSDVYRIIEEKKEKNAALQKQIDQLRLGAEENKMRMQKIQATIQPLQKSAETQIKAQWKKAFPQIRETEIFWEQLTCQFGMEDLGKIEQRLYELCHTSAPYLIAEPKKGGYQMEFRTVQGDLGRFGFVLQEKLKKLQFIERMGTLQEPAVTNSQLQKLLTLETVQQPPAPDAVKAEPDDLTAQLRQKLEAATAVYQKMESENRQKMTQLLEQTRQADHIAGQIAPKERQYQQIQQQMEAVEQQAMEESKTLREALSREKEDLMNTRRQYDILEQQLSKTDADVKAIKTQQTQLLQDLGQLLQNYKAKELEYRALIERYEKAKAEPEETLKSIRREMEPLKKQYESMKQKNKEELQSIQRKKSEAEELRQQIDLLNTKLFNAASQEK